MKCRTCRLKSQSRHIARLSLQASKLGSPTPSVAGECSGPGGGTHSLAGEGVGGPNSDEGRDAVVLYIVIV